MSLVEKDYIARLVKQLAQMLAAALKLRQSGKNEETLEAIHRASGDLLGIDWDVLGFSDALTAAGLLNQADKIHAYARLLEEEAITLRAMGRVADADRSRDRALALYREVLKRRADSDAEQGIARLASS